jgi:hypothetical protein
MRRSLLVLLLTLSAVSFARANNVLVTPDPAWAGDATVKVNCAIDNGVSFALPAPLPQTVVIPTPPSGNGTATTRSLACIAYRGTDLTNATIRSLAVSDTQTFPGILAPPSLSH